MTAELPEKESHPAWDWVGKAIGFLLVAGCGGWFMYCQGREAVNLCKDQPLGSHCWMVPEGRSSCFVWVEGLVSVHSVLWSGTCKRPFADGEGTLVERRGPLVVETVGSLKQGRPDGFVVVRLYHSQTPENEMVFSGQMIEGVRHGDWTMLLPDGTSKTLSYTFGVLSES